MGALTLLNHVLNFLAPALWLAFMLPGLSRFFMKKRPLAHSYIAQAALIFIVLLVASVAGLMLFGRDGKMLTYVALALLGASTQWAMHKGWQG
ncbi:hypothetical protein [Rhodoferax sp.]|uniref:hypothetical protein n=1 Tax=Rhodoferax sp. TaxID=50421 RepID=UPI002632CBEB|nr:hypothetical protein [Rhodoferax sp.]MDD2810800.1 hypothetical protein [Rhodoferax sp.]MDD5480537.1 hypothetical protein [Rhodoferax sp.]